MHTLFTILALVGGIVALVVAARRPSKPLRTLWERLKFASKEWLKGIVPPKQSLSVGWIVAELFDSIRTKSQRLQFLGITIVPDELVLVGSEKTINFAARYIPQVTEELNARVGRVGHRMSWATVTITIPELVVDETLYDDELFVFAPEDVPKGLIFPARLQDLSAHTATTKGTTSVRRASVSTSTDTAQAADPDPGPAKASAGKTSTEGPSPTYHPLRFIPSLLEYNTIVVKDDGNFTFGRDAAQSEVVLDHECVSRQQFRIRKVGKDAYELVDLASTNGTFLNGQRVMQAIVRSGDIIGIGSEIRLRLDTSGGAAVPTYPFINRDLADAASPKAI
jgi:FHA domain